MNSRYYDPEIGRFINADGQLNNIGNLLGYNVFAYCNNNPIMNSDSTGQLPFAAITAMAGAAIGAVVGGIKAAKTGKSVWKGALKGAAVGGAIGLGLGVIGSVALAGNVAASTAAVKTGAKMLKLANNTGGLKAGVKLIAHNVSSAVSNTGTVLFLGKEAAEQAANTFANSSGGRTLGSTYIGEIAREASSIPGANGKEIWSLASEAFCNQASGTVNGFVSNSHYEGVESIFWSVEMPALLNNPRVTEIIIEIFE